MRRDTIMEGLWIFQDSEYRKTQKNKPMGLYISKAFFFWGGELIFAVGKGYIREGLILGVKNKLRNAWGYTRGKNSC